MNKYTKTHREIPETQRESWEQLQASDKPEKDINKVSRALKRFGPCTSRQLASLTGLERTSTTRTIHDLQYGASLVYVAFEKPCPITKRRVRWYDIRSEFEQS